MESNGLIYNGKMWFEFYGCSGLEKDIMGYLLANTQITYYDRVMYATLTKYDLNYLYAIISSYCDKTEWAINGESIYTYKEIKPYLKDALKSIKKIKKQLEKQSKKIPLFFNTDYKKYIGKYIGEQSDS